MRATWFEDIDRPNLSIKTHWSSPKTYQHYIARAVELGAKVYIFEMKETNLTKNRTKPRLSYYVIHKDLLHEYDVSDFFSKRIDFDPVCLHYNDREIYQLLCEEYEEEERRLRRMKMVMEMLR